MWIKLLAQWFIEIALYKVHVALEHPQNQPQDFFRGKNGTEPAYLRFMGNGGKGLCFTGKKYVYSALISTDVVPGVG